MGSEGNGNFHMGIMHPRIIESFKLLYIRSGFISFQLLTRKKKKEKKTRNVEMDNSQASSSIAAYSRQEQCEEVRMRTRRSNEGPMFM